MTTANPDQDESNQGRGDGDAATTQSDGEAGPSARELGTTPKPNGKSMGKSAKEKKELHSRFLEYLEQEDDPVDLLFSSMSGRIKQELPSAERYQVAYKLMGNLNDYICSFKRQEVVGNTFLNPGAQAVSVANVIAAPPPPPMQARIQPTPQNPPQLTPRMVGPPQQQQAPAMGGFLPLLGGNDEDLVERQYTFAEI